MQTAASPCVAASSASLHLTFDDGPSIDSATRPLLELLASHGVTATFFVVGENARRDPAAIRAVVAAGHALGNHTERHLPLDQMSNEQVTRQFTDAQQAVTSAGGPTMTCYRPPFGATNDSVVSIGASLGMSEQLWDLDTRDYNRVNPQIYADVLASASDGDVVLLHDGFYDGAMTVEAVRRFLEAHRDDYQFLPLPGCAGGSEQPPPTPTPTSEVTTTTTTQPLTTTSTTRAAAPPSPVVATTDPPLSETELKPAGPAIGSACRDGTSQVFVDPADFMQSAIYRTYCSHLGRFPDRDGFTYWLDIARSTGSVRPLSDYFLDSDEFMATYGHLDTHDFVERVYANVLGRTPDEPGRVYWTGLLDSEAAPRSAVMLAFSESAEFRTSTGTS